MHTVQRKTTPRVKRGRVQKKNNWALTPNYYSHAQPLPVIDRERPGPGHRHLLLQRHIYRFIEIVPEWDELAKGLNAIVLARAEDDTDGWHTRGVVALCAWETSLWTETLPWWVEEHRGILDRLGVPCEDRRTYTLLKWTEATARCFQLVHVLLHELGHHHDRMTTQSRLAPARGEPYAEAYAQRYEQVVWDGYVNTFGLD